MGELAAPMSLLSQLPWAQAAFGAALAGLASAGSAKAATALVAAAARGAAQAVASAPAEAEQGVIAELEGILSALGVKRVCEAHRQLRSAGREDLSKRIKKLSAARNPLAHPDVSLGTDVMAYIGSCSEGGVASHKGGDCIKNGGSDFCNEYQLDEHIPDPERGNIVSEGGDYFTKSGNQGIDFNKGESQVTQVFGQMNERILEHKRVDTGHEHFPHPEWGNVVSEGGDFIKNEVQGGDFNKNERQGTHVFDQMNEHFLDYDSGGIMSKGGDVIKNESQGNQIHGQLDEHFHDYESGDVVSKGGDFIKDEPRGTHAGSQLDEHIPDYESGDIVPKGGVFIKNEPQGTQIHSRKKFKKKAKDALVNQPPQWTNEMLEQMLGQYGRGRAAIKAYTRHMAGLC